MFRKLSIPPVLVAAFALAVALAACRGAAPTEPVVLGFLHLPGEWRWVSSLDVRTLETRTPSSEGFEAELEFRAETDRAGTFAYRRNGEIAAEGRYSISSHDAPGNESIHLDTPTDFLSSHAWLTVTPDTLRLGGVMEAGHNSVFARVR